MDFSVLITGCNGYIGSEMCRYFKIHGWNVFGIDTSPLPEQHSLSLDAFEEIDVLDSAWKIKNLHAIIHLAGASKIADDLPDSHYRTQNVETTKYLREFYPNVPLYLASTTAMYNKDRQIEHKHIYTETKHEAEQYADVVCRMGTVCGANHLGYFDFVIDLMVHSAIKQNKIVVAQGAKMRPLAGITYICMMYHRNALNGVFARRASSLGCKVIQHLYECCHSIEDIGSAVHGVLFRSPSVADVNKIDYIRQNDLSGINKQAPWLSAIPPDFRPCKVNKIRLLRLAMECLERYEAFVQPEVVV